MNERLRRQLTTFLDGMTYLVAVEAPPTVQRRAMPRDAYSAFIEDRVMIGIDVIQAHQKFVQRQPRPLAKRIKMLKTVAA